MWPVTFVAAVWSARWQQVVMRLTAAGPGRGEATQLRGPAEMAAVGGSAEGRFGQGCRSEEAVVVFEQPGGDQPVSGRMLRRVAERVGGAVLSRTGEGAVQHSGGGEVKRVAGVP